MNIGTIKKNAAGQLIGQVSTLAVTLTVGLRNVMSANPRAPKFEIVALNAARQWVVVGALFELTANATGESFYQGKIDDPSMANPLYIALFAQEDGSFNVAWQRPTRRRSNALEAADYGDGDMFDGAGTDGDAGPRDGAGGATAGDGLGESTAQGPRKGKAKTDADAGIKNEDALPPLVDA
jgi:uncharacterized protein (DUF736 family)